MKSLIQIIIFGIFELTPVIVAAQDTSSSSTPFYVEIESDFTNRGFEKQLKFTNNLNRNIQLTYEGKQDIIIEQKGVSVNYGNTFLLPALGELPFKLIIGKIPLTF
jgi:hypothetical protein